jgi:ElaB/YqjD/DUF883 family membrane-anchored ribosome-binding protein
MRPAILLLAFVAHAADIPKGAHVGMKMVNSITTRTAKEGDYVYLTTATPIAADGRIVVPVGAYVQGVVTRSVRPGRVSGRAELAIRIETLTLNSGAVIRMAPHLAAVDAEGTGQKVDTRENDVKQGSDHDADAAKIATTAGMGAALGGISDRSWKGAGIGAGVGSAVGLATVLFTRGREVELRQGSMIDVIFDRPVTVE